MTVCRLIKYWNLLFEQLATLRVVPTALLKATDPLDWSCDRCQAGQLPEEVWWIPHATSQVAQKVSSSINLSANCCYTDWMTENIHSYMNLLLCIFCTYAEKDGHNNTRRKVDLIIRWERSTSLCAEKGSRNYTMRKVDAIIRWESLKQLYAEQFWLNYVSRITPIPLSRINVSKYQFRAFKSLTCQSFGDEAVITIMRWFSKHFVIFGVHNVSTSRLAFFFFSSSFSKIGFF